jgi:acyl-CoA reductase-like NAD-dependent aldehyde dehydrogenase
MSSASPILSINPATFEVVSETPVSTPEHIEGSVAAAHKAQPAWQALGVEGRVSALGRLHAELSNRREELAALVTKEMGRPISGSLQSIDAPLRAFLWNLDNAGAALSPETTFEDSKALHQIYYEPFGVFGVISPWNFPLSNFIMTALQPLLAGNTVIYKISEIVPLFGKALEDAVHRADLPAGVFLQIYGAGDVGEALARADIDHLHLTGSTAIGKKLYKIAAEKFIPITLELGGSDAGIVFEDAELDRLIEPIFWSRFINNGQRCCCLKRLYVHESRFSELVEKLITYVSKQKLGDPTEPSTVFGPMASAKQRDLIVAQVNDAASKGAKILLNGEAHIPSKGAYYGPTLLTGLSDDMRIWSEEVFGPVLPITSFATEDEAVALANDSEFGLTAFVYTQDIERYKRVAARLEAGSIAHNSTDYFQPFNPFGGYKNSGLGSTGGRAGLRSCCRMKVVTLEKP